MPLLLQRIRQFAMPNASVLHSQTWLRQTGDMRMTPADPWRPFTAQQTFRAVGVDFRWEAHIRVARWLPATIIDAVEGTRGTLAVKLFGIFPLVSFNGPALDKGEIMRGLAEMPWRPTGFSEQPGLTWTSTSTSDLTAIFDDGRIHASVSFEIDSNGRVLGVNALDRPRTVRKQVVETPWSGNFADYKDFSGIRVPTRAEVTWHLPEGPFLCWRAGIDEFRLI